MLSASRQIRQLAELVSDKLDGAAFAAVPAAALQELQELTFDLVRAAAAAQQAEIERDAMVGLVAEIGGLMRLRAAELGLPGAGS